MAHKRKKAGVDTPKHTVPVQENPATRTFIDLRWQWLILAVIPLAFYINTLKHDYALDDGLVIMDNPFTQEGLSGASKIFSHDSYYGYYQKYGSTGELEGGRYRPLSNLTHAVEWEFFKSNPPVSHAVNILLYLAVVLILYRLLHFYMIPGR